MQRVTPGCARAVLAVVPGGQGACARVGTARPRSQPRTSESSPSIPTPLA
ncbi:MAG: hypothetical protein JWR00_3179, partial [Rubritepida sp.]|nr:hypothetical protein [Rubritepida sp.]